MPAKPIYVNAVLCERALLEQDGVFSAIRLVDIFYVDPSAVSPEGRPIGVQLLLNVKFPSEDEGDHVVEIRLERPGEPPVKIAETEPGKATGRVPSAPKGINVVARFGVIPKTVGVHFMSVLLDGETVSRIPFMLQPRPDEAQKGPTEQ